MSLFNELTEWAGKRFTEESRPPRQILPPRTRAR